MASRGKADSAAKDRIKVEKGTLVWIRNRFERIVQVSRYKANSMLRAGELWSDDQIIYNENPDAVVVKAPVKRTKKVVKEEITE